MTAGRVLSAYNLCNNVTSSGGSTETILKLKR